jgi:hypothetical protein
MYGMTDPSLAAGVVVDVTVSLVIGRLVVGRGGWVDWVLWPARRPSVATHYFPLLWYGLYDCEDIIVYIVTTGQVLGSCYCSSYLLLLLNRLLIGETQPYRRPVPTTLDGGTQEDGGQLLP